MRKFFNDKWIQFVFFTILLLSLIVWAVSESHHPDPARVSRHIDGDGKFSVVTITETGTPPGDFTETLDHIEGYIDSIVIDSTGTDTNYTITLTDENAVTIFSGANLTSASEPYRYAISEADTDGNDFRGARVSGTCSLTMADGDDASLTAITVKIYYRRCW